MQGTLVRIKGTVDARAATQIVAHATHRATRRSKDGKRSTGPGKDARIDPLGQLRQKVPKDHRRAIVDAPIA